MERHFARAATATMLAVGLALAGLGCSSGPTTKEALCDGYDELSTQLLEGNGLFGNPLFKAAGRLGALALNYQEDADVRADGDALKVISGSEETTGGELGEASRAIAAECGKPPLGVNALLGG